MTRRNKTCHICLSPLARRRCKRLNKCECNIHYHRECLDEWMNYNNTCPICHQIQEPGTLYKFIENFKDGYTKTRGWFKRRFSRRRNVVHPQSQTRSNRHRNRHQPPARHFLENSPRISQLELPSPNSRRHPHQRNYSQTNSSREYTDYDLVSSQQYIEVRDPNTGNIRYIPRRFFL
jgi:hypothetical protein